MMDLSLKRRAEPALMAHKLVGVRPLTSPKSLSYAIRPNSEFPIFIEYFGNRYQVNKIEIIEGPMSVYKAIDVHGNNIDLTNVDENHIKEINERLFKLSHFHSYLR